MKTEAMSRLRFSVGLSDIHPRAGGSPPPERRSPLRPTAALAETFALLKQIGISAVQFYDDDLVPDIDSSSATQIMAGTRRVKQLLDDHGLAAESVVPRLPHSSPATDSAFDLRNSAGREYAIDRALRAVDLCREIGCDLLGLWNVGEQRLNAGGRYMIERLNCILDYDTTIRVFIKPWPVELIGRGSVPTIGCAAAPADETIDPRRVGGVIESAEATRAGLDPADEMAAALSLGKLFAVRLNDRDEASGVHGRRQGLKQLRVLVENKYGTRGEYVGLDVQAGGTQSVELHYRQLVNTLQRVQLLEQELGTATGHVDVDSEYGYTDAWLQDRNRMST